MFKRIKNFFRMLVSFFIEDLEDSIPLERRLAFDRQEKNERYKESIDKATDVLEAAELMVQGLAEARIVRQNIRNEALDHLKAAEAARQRGNADTEEAEQAAAAALADDLGEAEGEVEEMEQMVESALQDKKDSKDMLLWQARELERLARSDSRLVAKVRMAEMKDEMTRLKESLLELIPEDRDNIRARVKEQARRKVARAKGRSELIDALATQKKRGMIARATQTTARGAVLLRELQVEAGYQGTQEPPQVVTAETLKELGQSPSSNQ